MHPQSNAENEQDRFLDGLIADNTPVSIFMVNGVRLSGWLAGYDRHVVTLTSSTGIQTVYKHGISTIIPSSGVQSRSTESAERTRQSRGYVRRP